MAVYRIPFWRRRFVKNAAFLLPQGVGQTLASVAESYHVNAGDNITITIGHRIATVAETVPSCATVIALAPSGMVIAGFSA